MKESCRKDIASHPDPESCRCRSRKADREALTGAQAGQDTELRNHQSRKPTPWTDAEGETLASDSASGLGVPAQSPTLSMFGNSMHENREIP